MNYRLNVLDFRAIAPAASSAGMSKSMQVILYATVSTFYVANIYDHRLSAYLGLGKWALLGVLFVLCLVKLSRGARHRANVGLILLLIFPLALSMAVSDDAWRSIQYCISVAIVIVTGQLLAMLLSDGRQLRVFFDIFGNVGRLVIGTSALMWVLGLSLGRGDRFSGWVDNPNTLGLLLAPTLVILLMGAFQRRQWWVVTDGLFLAVGIFILLQTGSRSAFVWFTISSFALIVGRKMSFLRLVFCLGALVLFFNFWDEIKDAMYALLNRDEVNSQDELSGRSEFWQLGLQLFDRRPWFGYGFGMAEPLLEKYSSVLTVGQGGNLHNSYLTILLETGLIGVAIVVGILLASVNSGFLKLQWMQPLSRQDLMIKALPWAMVVGALMHAIFETWLFSAGNAETLLFWICFWLMRQGGMRFVPNNGRSPDVVQWR